MEAETYLSSGFGIQRAIESKPRGWTRFGIVARCWMPSRLKGIRVGPEFGTPFLAATQVYDVRPIPRKWLALERTSDSKNRFVRSGMILVTCSGSVGRPTLAYAAHEKTLISHDLIRVEALDQKNSGWIYAYLRAAETRAMAISSKYGHIIKHLETSHLEKLPIPVVDERTSSDFAQQRLEVLALRNRSYELAM